MVRNDSSYIKLLKRRGPFTDPDYDPTEENHKLLYQKVLVIGAGGLGCEILKNLALSGFKDIHVIDMDTIDVSNLNRQFLFRPVDVGRPKAEVAAECIMKRVRGVKITPYFARIQDKDERYYREFAVIICGLDSVEARRWINATVVNMIDWEIPDSFTPLIDGGTEGFRGQARVILPTMSSCYECSLDMLSSKTTFPVCTIANTPRLPEHCIEWARMLEWPKSFPGEEFDADNPDHIEWIYQKSLARAQEFQISGISKSKTLGVVKNIIPAIAATNAIIAASCCNEAFKLLTSCNPILENYMMYTGDDSIFTYTFKHEKKIDCPVCGDLAKPINAMNWWTLLDFIEIISTKNEVQMRNASLATARTNLYLRGPPVLEEATRPNLHKRLADLVADGEEIVITDPNLPISLKLKPRFSGPIEMPDDIGTLINSATGS